MSAPSDKRQSVKSGESEKRADVEDAEDSLRLNVVSKRPGLQGSRREEFSEITKLREKRNTGGNSLLIYLKEL